MGKRTTAVSTIVIGLMLVPSTAFACGGLVAPSGAVNLVRTTTLAAYHDGIEHYVTAFEFSGLGGATFGSIVPLPGEPTSVRKAGRWTLQRLRDEVAPPIPALLPAAVSAEDAPAAGVSIVLRAKVDSLDITVVEGGAAGVATWATQQGFALSPDAPEVLQFYAQRSRYFMAVSFDAARAARRGQGAGDSVPVHITIPIDDPWVPLRILALGRRALEPVDADVFLLTDRAPAMLPAPVGAGSAAGLPVARGLTLVRSERASRSLMEDLSSDRGMKWMPKDMWLTYLELRGRAGQIGYDLAIDPTGRGLPSLRAAGFPNGLSAPARNPVRGPQVVTKEVQVPVPVAGRVVIDRSGWLVAATLLALLGALLLRRRTRTA